MLPKATRSSSSVVFSSPKALMKFPHTHVHTLPNKKVLLSLELFENVAIDFGFYGEFST
jgi:hypothetical protein